MSTIKECFERIRFTGAKDGVSQFSARIPGLTGKRIILDGHLGDGAFAENVRIDGKGGKATKSPILPPLKKIG